jgi:hypothetical protein
MRIHYYEDPVTGEIDGGYKLSTVKKLLKEKGGKGWTEHCERDGGCFEVTPIEPTGSHKNTNYDCKYNRHL